MKTGLVTFFHIHHYGAHLQACATAKKVQALGSECEIVNYYVNQDNSLFRKGKSPRALAANAHTALHKAALQRRYDRFEAFAAEHLPIGETFYPDSAALHEAKPEYDVILSGSDQIWNPLIFPDKHFDPVYFGTFTHARRIAYAPSFAIKEVPCGMEEELAGYLKEFTHISTREKQGAKIVKSVTGKEVPTVLDPTLLLNREEWSAIARKPALAGGYILAYCINKPGALSAYIERLAAETGLPVVQLCGIRGKVHPKAKQVMDAGPAEFLGWFENASYVCTNSFHGTVFSTVFQKPFFTTVAPHEMGDPTVSRTGNLLSALGLTRRIIGRSDTADLLAPIDYAALESRLAALRERSARYLRCALENVPFEEEECEKTAIAMLAPAEKCTGCAACANICALGAITMVRDKEGFLAPTVDKEKCVGCGRCSAACPILAERAEGKHEPAVFAAWNADDIVRRDSTSGGVFSLIADFIIESGGVVFGAAMDSKMHVKHVACWDKKELWRLRGAKYVQSEMGNAYQEVEKALKTRPVLFTGTPCQVDGLYRYLGQRPENLVTCDLVCHGVPSPGVWEDMAALLQRKRGRALHTVRFRNKVAGWKNSHLTLLYEDGTADSKPLMQTEFGRAFGKALFLRQSCHTCQYANLNRPADFTLGDFWGMAENDMPKEQRKGVSLLLVNTEKGSHLFGQLPICKERRSIEEAVAGNPRLSGPLPRTAERSAFFAAYALLPFEEVRKRFLRLPPVHYRVAAKVLTPAMKEKIRKIIK